MWNKINTHTAVVAAAAAQAQHGLGKLLLNKS